MSKRVSQASFRNSRGRLSNGRSYMSARLYIELDGITYRVHDTRLTRGVTKLVPLGSPHAHYRVFVPQSGRRRSHKFQRGEGHGITEETLTRQLRGAQYLSAGPPFDASALTPTLPIPSRPRRKPSHRGSCSGGASSTARFPVSTHGVTSRPRRARSYSVHADDRSRLHESEQSNRCSRDWPTGDGSSSEDLRSSLWRMRSRVRGKRL
jgi:hypothetical protein